ncbi:centromere protein H (CENP-H)-domain-containing protein [Thermothelomyces heterothallicus CBS 202.75]|uniref:centromere protein H (CENP-H)-domain-containing protein n=1 Tax=Thermothelomyces heterothallicus CBS 202.75 TaxID=1149848 RepID=UPI003743E3F0
MASHSPSVSSPAFTETEASVLALYDQLQQLQLELALLQSQHSHRAPDVGSPTTGHDLSENQTRFLEAKATLALCNSVVERVVAVQPTLNAVHQARQASAVERDLLPIIQERDIAATKAANIYSELQTARARLAELEVGSLKASHRNRELAADVLQLASENHKQDFESIQNGRFGSSIADLESQVKSSRHRWRIIKGATSAIIAGSGIDWVRVKRLRELVLDPLDQ